MTCPLEVIKTRLQTAMGQNVMKTLQAGYRLVPSTSGTTSTVALHSVASTTSTPMMYLRYASTKISVGIVTVLVLNQLITCARW